MTSLTGLQMKKTVALLVSLFVAASATFADSLWSPDSSGLLTGASGLQPGDTILVTIDINQDLSYDSSRIDSERVSIELTGGEGDGLFSFLPSGSSSGNQSLDGSEAIEIETTVAVSVVGVDENGNLTLSGGRTVVIQGKQATVTLTGTVDPALLGEGRTLPISSIADARIVYETLLSTGRPNILSQDIEEEPVIAASAAEATVQTDGEAGEAGAAGITEPVATVPALTEEKKRELLLLYVNRLIDLVFE